MSWIFAPLEVLTDARLTDPERRVLLALFSFRNKETNIVWPGREVLAGRALIGDLARLSKLTRSLAEKGWLAKRKSGFSGTIKYELKVPEVAIVASETTSIVASETTSIVASETTSIVASETTSIVASETTCREHTSEHKNSGDKSPVSVAPDSGVAATAAPVCPHREIIALYHELLPELPTVLVERWDGARAKHLATRWRESGKHQSLAFWRWFFGQVRQRRFYLGENDRGWRADLGWLIERRHFDKILEAAVSAQRRRVAA